MFRKHQFNVSTESGLQRKEEQLNAPKKKPCRLISFILAITLLLTSCGVGGQSKPDTQSKDVGQTDETVMSPEKTSITTDDGITVDVGDYVLDREEVVSISKLNGEDHSEDGYKIDVYDIRLGDLHELDDFITIRIPYDTTYCDKGQNPAKCVGAKYKNEETGEWEDVLFEVDANAQELVIYTDHLSEYGVFCVANEGNRNAHITDIHDSRLTMSRDQAIDFASRIAEDDPDVGKDLREFVSNASDMFFDWSDRLDNAINIATLGDVPDWLSSEIPNTNQTLFSALGYLATAKNLMTIAVKDSVGGGASDGEILNLIRDVGTKVTTYWADAFTSVGSGALSIGMGGVLIIDKMLTAFAEEAKSTKLEDIGYVYHHYNEGFTSANWAHKLMKPKDWRKLVIQTIEKNPDDADSVIDILEEQFRSYASDFFFLTADQQAEVAADVPNVTVRRIPDFTEAEKNQMIDEYVAYLKDKFMPAILKSVQTYFIRKSEQAELDAINKIKNFYNTKITITISEDLKKGESSQYAGYRLRFAPLDTDADERSWTGTWPKEGKLTTTATLLGFMTAGYPHTVEFFKPDANINTDKPEFTVPFVISMPTITIKLEKTEKGKWVLTDSGFEVRENSTDGGGEYTNTFDGDLYKHLASYRYDPETRVDAADVPWFASYSCSISPLPKELMPESSFSIDINTSVESYDEQIHNIFCGLYVEADDILDEMALTDSLSSANGYVYGDGERPIHAGDSPGPVYGVPWDAPWIEGMSDTVTMTMPDAKEPVPSFRIVFDSNAGRSWFEYTWTPE